MIFATVPVAEAEGMLLAHSLRLPSATFKKGRALSAEDVALLAAAGQSEVTGVRLEPDDVTENEAAEAIAAAIAGSNVSCAAPFTGRSNLFAAAKGVVTIDRARLDALNRIDEAVTVATVTPGETVTPRQMIATIKVIPFAVDRRVVERCVAFAAEAEKLVSVRAFVPQRVGLVLTTLPGMKPSIIDATATASRARVESMGGRMVFEQRCPHEPQALRQRIAEALAAESSLLLIAGASATVDRRDTVPAAIVAAGGEIDHFGMPVDPGNLMLLGHIGTVPVLGLPGCARSVKPNGVDFVLRRLMAGIPVQSTDVMSLGAGGLLKETADRPLPRAHATAEAEPQVRQRPRIGALVLAAGLSSRMGRNKLLIQFGGKPLVAHVVEAALTAELEPVVVVTGHQAEQVHGALSGLPLSWVHNPAYADGLASSLKAGLDALPADLAGVLVCLGDMPAVTADHLARLLAAFDPIEGRAICVPVHRGKRGNPVLLGSQLFDEMRELSGDSGARSLVARHDEWVCEVPMPDDAVLTDVDTAEALARLTSQK
jgi:molybdenum cofactor cytidylyltransferase